MNILLWKRYENRFGAFYHYSHITHFKRVFWKYESSTSHVCTQLGIIMESTRNSKKIEAKVSVPAEFKISLKDGHYHIIPYLITHPKASDSWSCALHI
jgi:hypothetical protein